MAIGSGTVNAMAARRMLGQLGRRGGHLLRAAEARAIGSCGVLNYHRVAEVIDDPWALAVSPRHFDEQIAALRSSCVVAPPADAVLEGRWARIGRRPSRVVVTFDDGYVDNLLAALPVLERHDVPAILFVATWFVDRPSFWWDDLAEVVLGGEPAEVAAAAAAVGILPLAEPSAIDSSGLLDTIYERLVFRRTDEIAELVDDLADRAGRCLDRPLRRPMTSGELAEFEAHPLVTLGGHTVSHPRLASLAPDRARSEIAEGLDELSRRFGPAQRMFAYPYGNTNRVVSTIAADLGVRHAFTTAPRWLGPTDRDRLLPRLHPVDEDGQMFAAWLGLP